MTAPLLTNDELIEYLTGAAKLWLTDPGDSFMPMLMVEDATGQIHMINLATEGHPINGVLIVAEEFRQDPTFRPIRVALSVDTYAVQGKVDDPSLRGLAPTDLFAQGHPAATEAIAITIVTPETEGTWILPYKRTDTIEWGQPWDMPPESSHSGRVIEALRSCLGAP